MTTKQKVLFICTHNSARSQMAEGLLRSICGDRYDVASAGTIQTRVKPDAIAAMAAIGIDISQHRSKTIQAFAGQTFDVVVTVCDNAKEACPFFPGKKIIHQSFPDPGAEAKTGKESLRSFRDVRDQIKTWIEETF